jgi:hypothetical protein
LREFKKPQYRGGQGSNMGHSAMKKDTYLGNNTVAIPQGLKTTALLITEKSDECLPVSSPWHAVSGGHRLLHGELNTVNC